MTKDVTFEPVDGPINDRIDEAYRAKYRGSPYLRSMIGTRARSATVKVIPREDAKGRDRRVGSANMRLVAATLISLSLFDSASVRAQSIIITRSGSRPSRTGAAESFTGAVRHHSALRGDRLVSGVGRLSLVRAWCSSAVFLLQCPVNLWGTSHNTGAQNIA
jgi:uncharacterized protein DUF2255